MLAAVLLRLATALALASLLAPATAGAAASRLGLAEVRAADGSLLARAGEGAFAYPADGYVLRIGSASASEAGVELRDVSLLGGRVQVARLFVPAHGTTGASAEGVFAGGRALRSGLNALMPLGPGSYVVVLQAAVVPGRATAETGLVGLRVSVGDSTLGVPAGTQILVGLARAAKSASTRSRASATAWALLGLGSLRAAPATGSPGVPASWLLPTDEGASPGTSLGAQAVALAERFLGVPYVWGGASPSGGFDCSGLTMYVYAQLGVELPHFSGYQWYRGTRVAASDLQPGDLIFFHPGPNGPGHEGMYIGGGRFIHAPHTGDVVKISSLSEAGYAMGYLGATRPY